MRHMADPVETAQQVEGHAAGPQPDPITATAARQAPDDAHLKQGEANMLTSLEEVEPDPPRLSASYRKQAGPAEEVRDDQHDRHLELLASCCCPPRCSSRSAHNVAALLRISWWIMARSL